MEGNEEYLLRPVHAGLCSYESVITPGVLSLHDLALMNQYLDLRAENEYRIHMAREASKPRSP